MSRINETLLVAGWARPGESAAKAVSRLVAGAARRVWCEILETVSHERYCKAPAEKRARVGSGYGQPKRRQAAMRRQYERRQQDERAGHLLQHAVRAGGDGRIEHSGDWDQLGELAAEAGEGDGDVVPSVTCGGLLL